MVILRKEVHVLIGVALPGHPFPYRLELCYHSIAWQRITVTDGRHCILIIAGDIIRM